MPGFPVVVTSRGAPFVPVASGAPVATVAANGLGIPITLVASGAPPLVVEGYSGMFLISEHTFNGVETSYSFTGIPQTFSELRLTFFGRSLRAASGSDTLGVRFNGDTGTNYDVELGQTTGITTPTEFALLDQTYIFIGVPAATAVPATMAGCVEMTIPGYANSSFGKMALARGGYQLDATNNGMLLNAYSAHWDNAAAITSIAIHSANTAALAAGSIVRLYGVR